MSSPPVAARPRSSERDATPSWQGVASPRRVGQNPRASSLGGPPSAHPVLNAATVAWQSLPETFASFKEFCEAPLELVLHRSRLSHRGERRALHRGLRPLDRRG